MLARALALGLFFSSCAYADNYRHSIGGGLSYGEKLDGKSDFWGWTIDYGTLFDSGWSFTTSLAWDEETERRRNKPDKVVRSYTPTFVWSRPFHQRWSAGLGFGKGLINDDNRDGDYAWVDWDKEWSVGATLLFHAWQGGRHNINLATALEYDLSEGEPQLSVDINYAWDF